MADPGRSSFYWAMQLLPRPRREAMFAVYRYCRALDDIADEGDEPARQMAELDRYRRDIVRLFGELAPRIAEVAALAGPIRDFGLEREPLDAVIDGMEMDVRGEMRAPALETLQTYCHCVAGAVGLLAVRIFGMTGASGRPFALALGDALQLTNILRDLEEDAARGRLYVPRELLQQAGIGTIDPAAVLAHPRLPMACDLLAGIAADRYREALAALPADPRPLRPAMIMMAVYARLLQRLRGNGWASGESARIPGPERLWIALRHLGPPATWPNSI